MTPYELSDAELVEKAKEYAVAIGSASPTTQETRIQSHNLLLELCRRYTSLLEATTPRREKPTVEVQSDQQILWYTDFLTIPREHDWHIVFASVAIEHWRTSDAWLPLPKMEEQS